MSGSRGVAQPAAGRTPGRESSTRSGKRSARMRRRRVVATVGSAGRRGSRAGVRVAANEVTPMAPRTERIPPMVSRGTQRAGQGKEAEI